MVTLNDGPGRCLDLTRLIRAQETQEIENKAPDAEARPMPYLGPDSRDGNLPPRFFW